MAELSEKDKLTLWGANYKEVLAQAQAEGGAAKTSARATAAKIEKCVNSRFSAGALCVVGLLLTVSNFYAVSGPSVMLVGLFGIAAFILGMVWYVRLQMTIRQLKLANSA
ncbi:MAG TPA: hypothetical protein VG271_04880, partial [Beijerinckiaceae bacterium]|nr:hypothetical protein [Beijerinckiaceae bacterium]